MNKRSYAVFLVWGFLVWLSGIFWACWRYVPRVRYFGPPAKRTLAARLVRVTETGCSLDTAIHDCNLTLMGSCPADVVRERIVGTKITIGRVLFTWPRDADDNA